MKTRRALLIALGLVWLLVAGAAGEPQVRPVVNREYLPAVLKLINEASESIEFIQLELNDDRTMAVVEKALAAAVQRGVRVRGLLDDGVRFNVAALERLLAMGVEAKLDTPEKMTHCKLVIVDGRLVLLGSTNWTGNSMYNNNETNLLLDDPVLAGAFTQYAARLWEDSAAEPNMPAVVSGSVTTLLNRQYFPAVMELFGSATRHIHVIMYGVSYSPKYAGGKVNQLVEALVEAADRGVEVAMVVDLSNYNQVLNRVNQPVKDFLAGTDVAIYNDPLDITTHAKLIVADDAVVVGSVNWGKAALEERNECCVLVRDAELAAYFVEYFNRPTVRGERCQ